MRIEQSDLLGTAFLGVFAKTNEKLTFVPHNTDDDFVTLAEDVLGTEVVKVSVANSPLIGVLTEMNSKCIALPMTVYKDEEEELKSYVEVVAVESFTAVGNMISANDNGVAVSPLLREKELPQLENQFGVKAKQISIAGLDTTGACVVATSNGFLANPNTTEEEFNQLKKIFKVDGSIGSLNYGNPFVKGCILANSKGAIVGTSSTPFELGRVDDALFSKKE